MKEFLLACIAYGVLFGPISCEPQTVTGTIECVVREYNHQEVLVCVNNVTLDVSVTNLCK